MGNIFEGRIEAIREMMREHGWDAVVLTGGDPHSSEYPAPRWKQVEWVSGFTGEAGDLVITLDHAGLWTDTRYFIQAERQLSGTGVELHKLRIPGAVSIPQWLGSYEFPLAGSEESITVAVDGLCQSISSIDEIRSSFDGDRNVEIVSVPDLISSLWKNRPEIPISPVTTLGDGEAGESREHKLEWLRKFLMRKGCDAILLSSLDEICWLLNVRGSDIAYNPVVISYLLVTLEGAHWFVKKYPFTAPDEESRDSFYEIAADGVSIHEYSELELALGGMLDMEDMERIFIDPSSLNYHVYSQIRDNALGASLIEGLSPVPLRKAVKNSVEIEGIREAHFEDGIAMEKFLFWLDNNKDEGISEWDASAKLSSLRAEIPGFRGESFETISAYGENAALPHYATPEKGSAILRPRGLYLVDSGGQYLFGTTDITRTVPLGECSRLEMEDYTLVLKGHIDLAMAVFPEGTAGCQIDALARNPLWHSKRNFGHGTGHGVGFYLCVHEGPQDIRQNFNPTPLLPGMVISDEPGIYREGLHGVRHENLILCTGAGTNEFGSWRSFETLTLCHFDTSAILPDLLESEEIAWLNAYNERVYRTLSPRLPSEVSAWLRARTRPIG